MQRMDSDSVKLIPPRKSSIPSFISVKEGDETAFISALEPAGGMSVNHSENTESDQMADNFHDSRDCEVDMESPCVAVNTNPTIRISEETQSDLPDAEEQQHQSVSNAGSPTSNSSGSSGAGDQRSIQMEDSVASNRARSLFIHSKPVYLFYSICMMLSIAASVMGCLFTKYCPVAPELPIMIFMIGVTGTFTIIFKFTDLVHDRLYSRRESNNLFYEVACFVGYFIVTIILLAEISLVMQTDPSTIFTSRQYCHPLLYNFAYWTNWIGLMLTIIAAGIHGPALICRRNRSRYSSRYTRC